MVGVGWISAAIIGVIAGWLAEKIMKRDHGLLVNLLVGIIGGLIGKFVLGLIDFQYSGFWASLAAATLGAVILLFVLGIFKGKKR